jgi:hypothetical protein
MTALETLQLAANIIDAILFIEQVFATTVGSIEDTTGSPLVDRANDVSTVQERLQVLLSLIDQHSPSRDSCIQRLQARSASLVQAILDGVAKIEPSGPTTSITDLHEALKAANLYSTAERWLYECQLLRDDYNGQVEPELLYEPYHVPIHG